MNNQKEGTQRWQTLDIIKTIGCLGAIFSHILIWQFGKIHEGVGMELYDMSALPWQLLTVSFVTVHILFISAGASFYFYIKKYNPTFKKITSRLIPIILIGILFGLNYHPFILYWNVFFFYALSIITLLLLYRFSNYRAIFSFTIFTLIATPFLHFFLNNIISGNYGAAILMGDPQRNISFYPFFPWFFLVGAGFLVSHFYSQYRRKNILLRSLLVGGGVFFPAILFLRPIDLSDIFGVTSQIPIVFIVLTFSFFIVLLSSIELIVAKKVLSKYNPLVIIGRHIFPVYVLTLLFSLVLIDIVQRSVVYEKGNIYVFLISELTVFSMAYLIAVILTYRAGKSHDN